MTAPIVRQALYLEVADRLRDMIRVRALRNGEWIDDGEWIDELRLAGEMGISHAARGPQGAGHRRAGAAGAAPGLLRQRAVGARPGRHLPAHGHAGRALRLRGRAQGRRCRTGRVAALARRSGRTCQGRPHRRVLPHQLPDPRSRAGPGRQSMAGGHGGTTAQGAEPVAPSQPVLAGAHRGILRRAPGHLRGAQGARCPGRRGACPQSFDAPAGSAARPGAGRDGRRLRSVRPHRHGGTCPCPHPTARARRAHA